MCEGSEQCGTRPVLILQNDVGNEHSPTVIVAAFTDASKRLLPTHVKVRASQAYGLDKDSIVMLEQIRTIDKCKLRRKVGKLSEPTMHRVELALLVSLALGQR